MSDTGKKKTENGIDEDIFEELLFDDYKKEHTDKSEDVSSGTDGSDLEDYFNKDFDAETFEKKETEEKDTEEKEAEAVEEEYGGEDDEDDSSDLDEQPKEQTSGYSGFGQYAKDEADALFVNRFTYTQPLLKELYKGMLKWDKKRRINMIMIYVLLGINIAMNVVFMAVGNYDLFRLLIISLILLGAVAVFRALEPVILSRQVMRSYERQYSESMDVHMTFDEEYMVTHDVSLGAAQQRALTYDRITSVHESEHFIVLRLDRRQVMSIHKDGFLKGTLEDFRPFILRKIEEKEGEYE